MQLDLVDNGLDAGVRPQIQDDSDVSIRDSDALNEASINETFKFRPDLVSRGVLDEVLPVFPDELWTHPVHQVEIYIVELQLGEGTAKSTLYVFSFILPQLSSDKNFLTLNLAGCENLLQRFTNGTLILIDRSSVNVTVTLVEDCIYHYDLAVSFA